jgi:hypothetical protein
MSIIQEALKKAENSKPQAAVPNITTEERKPDFMLKETPPAAAAKARPAPKKANKANRAFSPIFILMPIFFAAVILAAFFAFKVAFKPKPAVTAPAAPVVQNAAPSRQEVVRKDAAPVSKEVPKFELSGIMQLDAGPKAIINGSVVKEGDAIGGATVGKINNSDVVLNYEDFEIQLKLKD